MTRKQLAEAIFNIEAKNNGWDESSKAVHVNAMLDGFGRNIKLMKKAELESRLANLTEGE